MSFVACDYGYTMPEHQDLIEEPQPELPAPQVFYFLQCERCARHPDAHQTVAICQGCGAPLKPNHEHPDPFLLTSCTSVL